MSAKCTIRGNSFVTIKGKNILCQYLRSIVSTYKIYEKRAHVLFSALQLDQKGILPLVFSRELRDIFLDRCFIELMLTWYKKKVFFQKKKNKWEHLSYLLKRYCDIFVEFLKLFIRNFSEYLWLTAFLASETILKSGLKTNSKIRKIFSLNFVSCQPEVV